MNTNMPRLTLLSDLVSEFIADTEAALKALESGVPRGPVTGLHRLDETLGGYFANGLHILQAAPGAGKSAFSLQTAAKCRFPALYLTVEMGVLELFRRLIARETDTYLGRLKTGELGAGEALRLALQTVENLPNFAILDGTSGYAAPKQILEVAESLKDRAGSSQVLVVVDSIQVWSKTVRNADMDFIGASEYELINAALGSLSGLAHEIKSPVLAVSHRNRAGNRSNDAGLHAAKGSGEVEYLAESVIDLTRKDEHPDLNGEVEISLKVLKNRHGIPGLNVPLKFSGRLQKFRETL